MRFNVEWEETKAHMFAALWYVAFFWACIAVWGDGEKLTSFQSLVLFGIILILTNQDVAKYRHRADMDDMLDLYESVKENYPAAFTVNVDYKKLEEEKKHEDAG